jgi:hypothetical protein
MKIKPVFHLIIGSKAFQVVAPPKMQKKLCNMLISKDYVYINNDDDKCYDVAHIMQVYKEEM